MKENRPSIIVTMRYKDAPAAIEWLCNTFRFEKHLVVEGEDNTIAHAQLTFRNGMIMLGSDLESEFGQLVKTPDDLDGYNTQTPYIIVDDIIEHYQHAIEAGAEIIIDLQEQEYGGKLYTCRDPEGYIWNFGSYNPWEENN